MSEDKAPQPGDTLGDRVKRYEAVTRPVFTPNSPVIIRVDGKAFHTFTKGLDKPFDNHFIDSMVEATRKTAKQMQGFKLAYTQSDEATFMITDTDSFEQQGWFGYSANKIVSVTASMFTVYFNVAIQERYPALSPGFFDARAFSVPEGDAPNVFLWRQRDWERNSIMMCARWHYSHAKLQGKKRNQLQEAMWQDFRFNWSELDAELKNGTFVTKGDALCAQKLDYDGITALIRTSPTAGVIG